MSCIRDIHAVVGITQSRKARRTLMRQAGTGVLKRGLQGLGILAAFPDAHQASALGLVQFL